MIIDWSMIDSMIDDSIRMNDFKIFSKILKLQQKIFVNQESRIKIKQNYTY